MAGKESVFQKITRTCSECLAAQDGVRVDSEAVVAQAGVLSVDEISACCRVTRYPCKFDDLEHEITFMSLMRILDFGSGYDDLLTQKIGKASKDVVQNGVVGMHITATATDTEGMKHFPQQVIMTLFGIDSHEDADSGIAGVSMSKPGPLAPYTQSLREAIVSVGEALDEEGAQSFGHFVVNLMKDITAGGKPPLASRLVAELADTFSTFDDQALVAGKRITFHRKACLLALDLYLRFGASNALFKFADVDEICADSGASAIGAMCKWGVLECSGDVAAALDSSKDIESGAKERALRAAAVCGMQALAEKVGLPAWKVGWYANHLVATGGLEGVKVHRTKGTAAY